ncbi:hypothetical protein [Streptomyces sp. NPDC005438]|uniref:hypothetical protein n=1 Tax=Streptomyces sp. NPDC005438 TaxID=3156880 RepID=UPI0033A53DA6
MTVPTPSSHNPDPRGARTAPDQPAWHGPPPGGDLPYAPPVSSEPEGEVVDPRRELVEGALTALGVAVLGVLLGALWCWLAPRVPLVSDGEAVYLKDPEGEETFAIEGTFVMLSLAMGAVVGAAAFLARRRGGIGVVLGLGVGALLGAVIAWQVGVFLGPPEDVAARAREVGSGVTFDGPLKLDAKAAFLAWPVTSVATHLLLTALFGPADPEPQPPGPVQPDGD